MERLGAEGWGGVHGVTISEWHGSRGGGWGSKGFPGAPKGGWEVHVEAVREGGEEREVPVFGYVPIEGVEGVDEHGRKPVQVDVVRRMILILEKLLISTERKCIDYWTYHR